MDNAEIENQMKPTYENVFHGEYKELRLVNRRVICAACRFGDVIVAGARHFDTVMHGNVSGRFSRKEASEAEQGFIDQFGIFLTREEAYVLAKAKGQIKDTPCIPGTLFSEDLY